MFGFCVQKEPSIVLVSPSFYFVVIFALSFRQDHKAAEWSVRQQRDSSELLINQGLFAGVSSLRSLSFSAKYESQLRISASTVQYPVEKPPVYSGGYGLLISIIVLNLLLVLPVCQAHASASPCAFCSHPCLAFLSALV